MLRKMVIIKTKKQLISICESKALEYLIKKNDPMAHILQKINEYDTELFEKSISFIPLEEKENQ